MRLFFGVLALACTVLLGIIAYELRPMARAASAVINIPPAPKVTNAQIRQWMEEGAELGDHSVKAQAPGRQRKP